MVERLLYMCGTLDLFLCLQTNPGFIPLHPNKQKQNHETVQQNKKVYTSYFWVSGKVVWYDNGFLNISY